MADDPDLSLTQGWSGAEGGAEVNPIPPLSESAIEGMLEACLSPRSRGWQPPTAEELQRHLPQYEVRALLGRGGMGAVYQCWQRSLERLVAIKILPPGLESESGDFIARFQREAKAMARLKHPGIVPVHDAGETQDGLLYFVMDYVEGADVQKLIAAQGRLPEEQALTIVTQVLDALAYAHERGIIHRDIKPANIMIDQEGHVQVADFGLARSVSGETSLLTGHQVAMGTPDFMAPESRLGSASVDQRADLYAVGVMLYQMLTGKLPHGRFEAPSRIVPTLDKRLDRIVDRALQPDRDARYSTALELRAQLDPVLARSVARNPKSARPAARGRILAGAAVGLVAVLGGTAWMLRQPKLKSPAEVAAPPAIATTSSEAPAVVGAAIRLWDSPDKIALGPSVQWKDNALKFDKGSLYTVGIIHRDAILRASIRADPTANAPAVGLRARFYPGGGHDGYALTYDVAANKLKLYSLVHNSGGQPLKVWPLPRTYGAEEWVQLELKTVGDTVTVSVDGQEIGTVHDNSQPAAGHGIIGAVANGCFRDVVYVPLDRGGDKALQTVYLPAMATTPAPAPATPSASLEPGAIRIFDSAEKLPLRRPGVAWKDGAMNLEKATVGTADVSTLPAAQVRSRDGAIRASIRMNPDSLGAKLAMRDVVLSGDHVSYNVTLQVNTGVVRLVRMRNSRESVELGSWRWPRTYGPEEWIPLELRAVGTAITVSFDGRALGTVRDDALTEAGAATIGGGGQCYFRDIVYVPLDAGPAPLPHAEPAPAGGVPLWNDRQRIPLGKQIQWDRGVLKLDRAHLADYAMTSRDGAIRASIKVSEDPHDCGLALRFRESDEGPIGYQASIVFPSRQLRLIAASGKKRVMLATWPLPANHAVGEWMPFELRVVGDLLTASADGQPLGSIHDSALMQTGGCSIFASGQAELRDIVYVPFDQKAESPAPATPAPPATDGNAR